MEVLISGRSGTALIQANGSFQSLTLDSGACFAELEQFQATRVYSGASDWNAIEVQTDSEILDALTLASCQSEALDSCLFIFDSTQSNETCSSACELLAGLLDMPGVQLYLEDIFFAKPLPATANVRIEVEDKFSTVKRFTKRIISAQSAIRKVRDAWTKIPFSIHIRDGKTEQDFESACLKNGVFRKLVDAFGSTSLLNQVQLATCADEALSREFPGLNMLVSAWVSAIRKAPGANSQPNRVRQQIVTQPDEKEWRLPSVDDVSDPPQHSSIHQAFTATISMIERVVDLATAGKDVQALDILNQLVDGQLQYEDGASNAIRSLCNIAKQLRKASRQDFALDCLNRAIDLEGDAKAYQQLGAVLIDVEEFDSAEKALKKANELSASYDSATKNSILSSIAHLYESQYKFDLALQVYDSIDPVFVGHMQLQRADTLRKMGNLDAAMRLYVQLLHKHRTNDRAIAGKAEIARRRGNPHKGIRHYNYILKSLEIEPESKPVYQLALGNLFKMTGQTKRASDLAFGVLQAQPYNKYATLLLASLHGIEGDFNRAIQELPEMDFGKTRVVEAMLEASRGNIDRAKENLKNQLEQTRLLLEDRFFLKCGSVALSLATYDVQSAKETIALIPAQSSMERAIESVLQVHISAIEGDVTPKRVRSRRLVADWHRASDAILNGDFSKASQYEFGAILKCA